MVLLALGVPIDAGETGRPKDSADIVACARAVAALPMMHLDAALNQDWIFPAERRECTVEGFTVQYSGGFEVRFPIFKGPYSFGSTSALAAAVGFTAPRRTNSINDALNPNKERRKGITTERACTAGASP